MGINYFRIHLQFYVWNKFTFCTEELVSCVLAAVTRRLSYLFIRLRLHSHFVSLLMFQQSFSFFEILFDVVIRVGFLQSSSYARCLVGCWQQEKFAPFWNRFAHFHKYLLAMLVRFLFMMAHERDSPQNSSARAQSSSQRDESQSNNDSQTETQPSSHFENRNNSDRKLKSFSGSKQKK